MMLKVNIINMRYILVTETITMPSLMVMTSTVSEEHAHMHASTHARTHTHTQR